MMRLACLLIAAATLTGCTGLEPATLSAGASVAQSGVTLLGRGKAQAMRVASFDATKSATADAAAELGLILRSERGDAGYQRRTYVDGRGQLVTVHLKRRTPQVMQLKTDVGLFGPDVLAVFVLEHIVAKLDPPAQ